MVTLLAGFGELVSAVGGFDDSLVLKGVGEANPERAGKVVIAGAGVADRFAAVGLAQALRGPGGGDRQHRFDHFGDVGVGELVVALAAVLLDAHEFTVQQL